MALPISCPLDGMFFSLSPPMNKLFTFATAALTTLALGAQAQATIDGTLNAAEKDGAATTGDYVLLGQYPYVHGFGPAGLLSLYGANTPTKVQMFVGGTLQPYSAGNNSFQLFIDLPAATGVAMGTALPAPTANTSSTSFDKFTGKLDQGVELGLALHTNNTTGQYQVEAVAYQGSTATDTIISATASPLLATGTVLTLPTITKGQFKGLSGARVAYQNTSDGALATNPGYVAPLTAAGSPPYAYGTADGTTGWEIELDRTALGLPSGNPTLGLFVQQNNNEGDYVSSDYLPNPAFNSGANLGTGSPDYTAIAGTQSATFALATVTLATRAAAEVLALGVYPNPTAGQAMVSYKVAAPNTLVSISLVDLLGRTVRVVDSGLKNAGVQAASLSTTGVTAGTYLMRVQVGDNVATSKVVLL